MIVGLKVMCFLTIIPVKADRADEAEIVTQMLFGEVATVVEQHNQWLKVNIAHDGYIGWIDEKQVTEITENAFATLSKIEEHQQEPERLYDTPWGEIKVIQGSPVVSNSSSFLVDSHNFEWRNPGDRVEKSNDITELAIQYSNTPYLWGGRTKYGIDCSGFTQTVLHQLGIMIHRDASQQAKQGKEIKFKSAKPGDLAFFVSKKGKVTHVGIVLNDNKIIHASGYVRIDQLTEEGIYNEEKGEITHQFYSIRRYQH
jgi:cell wall-associated NlpC family hydrolase